MDVTDKLRDDVIVVVGPGYMDENRKGEMGSSCLANEREAWT